MVGNKLNDTEWWWVTYNMLDIIEWRVYINIDWFTDCWMEVNGSIEWDMLNELLDIEWYYVKYWMINSI